MGVWILLMLVFTLASPFLFRVALPWPLIPALGIALSIILSMLIVRVIGLRLRQALLKSTLMVLLGEILVQLVLGGLGMIVLVIFSFSFLYTRVTKLIISWKPWLSWLQWNNIVNVARKELSVKLTHGWL